MSQNNLDIFLWLEVLVLMAGRALGRSPSPHRGVQ